MAVINYSVKENKTLGTHSFYAQAVSFSTLDFQDLADEVVEGLGITPELVNTILTRYMRVAKRNVLRGHRVKFGDLLTIYPQISCSVKDELNDDGTVKKAATADMINVLQAKSTIGATIALSVQQSFAMSVSWKRIANATDSETDEGGDDTPTGDDTQQPSGDGTQQQSGNSQQSGDGTQQGDSQQQNQTGNYRLSIQKTGNGTATVTDQNGQAIADNAEVASGTTINLSVVPVEGKTPVVRIDGTDQDILTENDGTWTGSFQMPAKATTLSIFTDPEDSDAPTED